MPPRPFVAVLPKTLNFGDEIILKGKIQDDARQFSVNFCLDTCNLPSHIAYHFKTLFDGDPDFGVVHNYKSGHWGREIVEPNTWIDKAGAKFSLTFHFTDQDIIVYADDMYQYKFEHVFNIDDIQTVQLWDDIDYVEEITFRYRTP